jgi:hypothetical protein
VEGLDIFYSDYRNKKIRINDAVWLIVNSITGKSQEEMDVMIENYRENAD